MAAVDEVKKSNHKPASVSSPLSEGDAAANAKSACAVVLCVRHPRRDADCRALSNRNVGVEAAIR